MYFCNMRNARILIAVMLICLSCGNAVRQPVHGELPYGEMREGDLVFRCGMGVFSRAVTAVEEEGLYSHVGLLLKDSTEWVVVHSVPREPDFKGDFDRVKKEPIESFLSMKRAAKAAIAHTGLVDSVKLDEMRASAFQAFRDSLRFDDGYSLQDSTRQYCSEFVWRLYLRAGIDLSEGRRTKMNVFLMDGDCILPEHLYKYKENEFYYNF